MLVDRTAAECITTVVHQVDNYLSEDICYDCAFRLVGKSCKMDPSWVERVWIKRKEEEADASVR